MNAYRSAGGTRLPVHNLLPLAAAACAGTGVALGLAGGGLRPAGLVGAGLCLVALGLSAAAGALLDGLRRTLVLLAGSLAAVAFLPPPYQPLPVGGELGAIAAAAALHALAVVLSRSAGLELARDGFFLLVYLAGALVGSQRLPWPEAALAFQLACGLVAAGLLGWTALRARSLVREALALRLLLSLLFAGGAAGAAWLLAPETPALAGGVATLVLAAGLRRGAADAASGETSFSPAEPVATVLVAALCGAVPLALGEALTDELSALALAGAVFAALLAAPSAARLAGGAFRRAALGRGPDLERACDEAALATEQALSLDEIAAGLSPVAAALPRGALAVVALEADRTAVLREGDVEVVSGAGHGPALGAFLGARRRPVLAALVVERSVRELPLRPAADLVSELRAEIVVPLPCGDSLSGALLVGRPRLGRLRGRRAALLARLAEVLGPRVHAGALLEAGGRRIATLEGRLLAAEDAAERRAYELERLDEENRLLRADRAGTAPREIVGRSPAMKRLLAELRRAASAPAAVLVHGEPGVGRALVARTVHDWSARRERPLVRFECGGPPEGHALALQGLSGEGDGRPGLIELSHGGTLVLEEVTELSAEGQAVVLRALSSGEVHRAGGLASRPVDVRLVATSGAAAEAVLDGEALAPELRDRLRAFRLEVPPLRQRRGDVPHLSRHFLAALARRHGRPAPEIAPEALEALEVYDWPGNVAQLRAVMEHAGVVAQGRTLGLSHLPSPPAPAARVAPGAEPGPEPPDAPLEGTYEEVERRVLTRALERARGNKSEAARLLGLKRTTFVDRLRKHELG